MVNTILLDLDGTLLQFSQDEFITAYFTELKTVFIRLGLDADFAIKAVWAGTKAMVLNDGAKTNAERFWEEFSGMMGLSGKQLNAVEESCDKFYANEFDAVRSVLRNDDPGLPCRLVRTLASKGFSIVLATNPLFPASAVTTRLGWIGLSPRDFCLITNYSNSTYCKPNHDYYREIFGKIDRKPSQCLMIGNNTREDMCAGALGVETFLVSDYLENETGMDISVFRHGTLAEAEEYLASLPHVGDINE